jgi:damage-control phosphatase, subfamily II, stand-alone protein
MPFVRELGLGGTKIVLACNELPSLNDMTADETAIVVEELAQTDEDLSSLISAGMVEVVSTGNDIPLIDLSQVSDELNEAALGAELVILAGMGRSAESNFNAAFSVDSLKLALLKDPVVAQRLGGTLFDCVCKYEPAPVAPPA